MDRIHKNTAGTENSHLKAESVIEEVVEEENMLKAYRRVVANKGAAGVDGITVEQLAPPPYADLYVQWCRRMAGDPPPA